MRRIKKQKVKYKLKNFFHHRKNLKRGAVIAVSLIFLSALVSISAKQPSPEPPETENFQIDEDLELEVPALDTTGWKDYQNNWYGFKIKYPENWDKPLSEKPADGEKWEYRYQFRKKEAGGERDLFLGFDVAIYAVSKTKELSDTEEFPSFKQELNENETCRFITGQITGKENFSAEEVFVPPSDSCHKQAFFYSLIKDEYIFNVAPVYKESWGKGKNLKNDAIRSMPEFFSAASSFELVDIVRKTAPVPTAKPKSRSPLPVSAEREGGRLVCAKKNDHPGTSKKNKGKHLDMECCLDPDEYPNPHCYYSASKYGKYLK